MLFDGENVIEKTGPQGISATYGKVRNYGKTWHFGKDIHGVTSKVIHMPYFKGNKISGTVITARMVPKSSGNKTWEWGYYVCVRLDANQTSDAVNYLYFCHCRADSFMVSVGQKVISGDPLAIMGKTGNAATTYEHCHFEVRASSTGKGLDPSDYDGLPNAPGTYSDETEPTSDIGKTMTVSTNLLNIRKESNVSSDIKGVLKEGSKIKVADEENGFVYFEGYVSLSYLGR